MRRQLVAMVTLAFVAVVPAHAADIQWVKTGGPSGGLGYNVKVHPLDKNIMFVTDAWAGVHRTVDAGRTWQASNTGIDVRVGPSSDGIPVEAFPVLRDYTGRGVITTPFPRGIRNGSGSVDSSTETRTLS